MFTQLTPTSRKRWDLALLLSFVAHGVALLMLIHHPAPVFVMPSDVALGAPGSSGSITYLAPVGTESLVPAPVTPRLKLDASVPKAPPPLAPTLVPRDNSTPVDSSDFDATARGGSLYGARVPGAPLTGHEIVPALPQVFPILRSRVQTCRLACRAT